MVGRNTRFSVSADRYGDIVLWQYAFARQWFKVNLTTDLGRRIVDIGSSRREIFWTAINGKVSLADHA